jgi:hypothetical protein
MLSPIGRFFRWLFIDPLLQAAAFSFLIVLGFAVFLLSFFRPYTSDPWPRVASWIKWVKHYLAKIQGKQNGN